MLTRKPLPAFTQFPLHRSQKTLTICIPIPVSPSSCSSSGDVPSPALPQGGSDFLFNHIRDQVAPLQTDRHHPCLRFPTLFAGCRQTNNISWGAGDTLVKSSPVTYPLPGKFLPHPELCSAKRSRKLELDWKLFLGGSVCLFCAWHSSKRAARCEQIKNDERLRLLTTHASPSEDGVTQDALSWLRKDFSAKRHVVPTRKQNNQKSQGSQQFTSRSLSIKGNSIGVQEQLTALRVRDQMVFASRIKGVQPIQPQQHHYNPVPSPAHPGLSYV